MLSQIDYFSHEADIGIIARGASLEETFIAAAQAVFGIMTNLSQVKPSQVIAINFIEADIELALVTWLNLLLAKSYSLNLIFTEFKLRKQGDCWLGEAFGEPWHEGLVRGTEVKGATLTMLSVQQQANHLWQATCVVDV